jgi:hypothetical protein
MIQFLHPAQTGNEQKYMSLFAENQPNYIIFSAHPLGVAA